MELFTSSLYHLGKLWLKHFTYRYLTLRKSVPCAYHEIVNKWFLHNQRARSYIIGCEGIFGPKIKLWHFHATRTILKRIMCIQYTYIFLIILISLVKDLVFWNSLNIKWHLLNGLTCYLITAYFKSNVSTCVINNTIKLINCIESIIQLKYKPLIVADMIQPCIKLVVQDCHLLFTLILR